MTSKAQIFISQVEAPFLNKMTAFYIIDRMLVYHAAKIAHYQQTLGGSDGEAKDSKEESDDESESVTHERRIVATA